MLHHGSTFKENAECTVSVRHNSRFRRAYVCWGQFLTVAALILVVKPYGVSCRYNDGKCLTGDCINGHGVFVYENGSRYAGQNKNGLMEGFGVLVNGESGDRYEGMRIADLKEGHGVYTWGGRKMYWVGDWKNNKRHGHGRHYDDEGRLMYEGEYVEGEHSGYGVFYWPTGERYEGQWVHNLRHGHGRTFDAQGHVFHEGQYIDDKPVEASAGSPKENGNEPSRDDSVTSEIHSHPDSMDVVGAVFVMSPEASSGMFAERRKQCAERLGFLTRESNRLTPQYLGIHRRCHDTIISEFPILQGRNPSTIRWGRFANLMGARMMWRACVNQGHTHCLCLEDDAEFTKAAFIALTKLLNSTDALQTFDLISLGVSRLATAGTVDMDGLANGGLRSKSNYEEHGADVPSSWSWVRSPTRSIQYHIEPLGHGHLGSHAYVISAAAARHMLSVTNTPSEPTDVAIINAALRGRHDDAHDAPRMEHEPLGIRGGLVVPTLVPQIAVGASETEAADHDNIGISHAMNDAHCSVQGASATSSYRS